MYISNIDEININIINNLISDGVLSNYEFEIARNLIEEIKNKTYNYNKFDIDIYNNSMASDLHKSIAFHLEAIKELKNKQYIKASEYLIKEQLLLINMNEYLLLKKNHNLLAYIYYKNENLENAKNIFKNILSYKFLEKKDIILCSYYLLLIGIKKNDEELIDKSVKILIKETPYLILHISEILLRHYLTINEIDKFKRLYTYIKSNYNKNNLLYKIIDIYNLIFKNLSVDLFYKQIEKYISNESYKEINKFILEHLVSFHKEKKIIKWPIYQNKLYIFINNMKN